MTSVDGGDSQVQEVFHSLKQLGPFEQGRRSQLQNLRLLKGEERNGRETQADHFEGVVLKMERLFLRLEADMRLLHAQEAFALYLTPGQGSFFQEQSDGSNCSRTRRLRSHLYQALLMVLVARAEKIG